AYHPCLAPTAIQRHTPEAGAVCEKDACPDLCGGREVTRVPTATKRNASSDAFLLRNPSSVTLRDWMMGFALTPSPPSPARGGGREGVIALPILPFRHTPRPCNQLGRRRPDRCD